MIGWGNIQVELVILFNIYLHYILIFRTVLIFFLVTAMFGQHDMISNTS